MDEYDENGYSAELREKPVCRFCLTTDEALTNIYSVKSNANSQASLPMQIMSCVSIEVCAFFTQEERMRKKHKSIVRF